MEMPRQEMEVLASSEVEEMAFDPWDDVDDDGDDSWDFQLDDVSVTTVGDPDEAGLETAKPPVSIAAAAIKTAAMMSRELGQAGDADVAPESPRVSPDLFRQGMAVIHPEYGPGKVVALSGSGKNRRATIQFATVGPKKIILAHGTVRPAR